MGSSIWQTTGSGEEEVKGKSVVADRTRREQVMCQQEHGHGSLVVPPTVNKTAEILRWLSEEPGQTNRVVFPESGKNPVPRVKSWKMVNRW